MHRVLVVLAVLGGCSKVVKQEGFRATIAEADDPKVEGTFEALGDPSCGRFQPDRREVHLKADRFVLDVLEEPFSGKDRAVSLVIDGERYVSDRPGAETALVIDNPRGRIIGSLRATLIHESAGTTIDGRPAPVRELGVDLTFNLQPCL